MTAVDDIEVVRATSDQWERVRDLRLAALEDAPDAFWATLEDERDRPEQDWREWLRPERRLLLATLRNEGAGFRDAGLAAVGPHHEQADVAGLYAVWVAPWARGRGVGDALIEDAIERARAMGYPRILLDVGDRNETAIALYERLGFAPTGRASAFPPPRGHITEHERARDLSDPAGCADRSGHADRADRR